MAGDIFPMCNVIRQTSLALYRYLRGGHMEKVYEKGLLHRLSKQGLKVQAQHPLTVCDEDGTLLGNYYADLFVEDCLIVELKTCDAPANAHIGQLLGYLRASSIEHGMLINFGPGRFEIRKFILSGKGLHEEPESKDGRKSMP